ncbi:MAG TPA: tetratricopeptide repeat protein [Bryobacteraceae bacterium]|nr:tetratricopeptide repeat protein [Bryobacteraceae bacterium]
MSRWGTRIAIFGMVLAARTWGQPAAITIDYPEDGSIFPPEITAPTFLWRDTSAATAWRIEVAFGNGAAAIRARVHGERLRIGETDPRAVADTNAPPALGPREAAAWTWVPGAAEWEAIKHHSVERTAVITITGLKDEAAVSFGRVGIRTSKDPVGAPIFYRDVPLMPSELKPGVIKPLSRAAIPLVAWRLRDVGQPRSRLLVEGLHSCANCHSFSRDGKTLGIEMDGPQNERKYAFAPIAPRMSIRNEDVITWTSVPPDPGRKTLAFMPQLSPDGQFAVATVNEAVYVSNFKDYRFLQVFYPTRGILAVHSRATGRTAALPGADDPRFVQTSAVWSPGGDYLVFSRAPARDPYPEGLKIAEYSNDPNEVPMRYDLYRIPFNGGRGGHAEPIPGASRNGMSNTFPKVSPDGRWIVFVQCRNGQLLRPDGKLYIVPAEGGEARRMRCNTPLMNSWHSFSPNGRWLVFSSKSRSPYTQMFLTHIDEQGHDSPAILIENATAANRAVNIPEFVNIPAEGLLQVEVPAAEFYRVFDDAWELAGKGRYGEAIAEWNKALELSPGDAKAHNNLGTALARMARLDEAMTHWRKALGADPGLTEAHNNLGIALVGKGMLEEGIAHFRKALDGNPASAEIHDNLGMALLRRGRPDEAMQEFRKGLEVDPRYPGAHRNLGIALAGRGKFDEAIAHFRQALEAAPEDAETWYNLGVAMAAKAQWDEAQASYEKALKANPNYVEAYNNLGSIMARKGTMEEAIARWRKALDINPEFAPAQFNLASALYSRGNVPEALAHWRAGLRRDARYVPALTQTAWVLATCPDGAVRNGKEAVTLASRAAELTGGRDPAILDTLAAAYAEVGRYAEAVSTARRALDIARQQDKKALAGALKTRMALYEARTAFRVPVSR